MKDKTFSQAVLCSAVILSAVAGFGYCSYSGDRIEDLKKQVYEIADKNKNKILEDSELSSLGNGLELIAGNETLNSEQIRGRINAMCSLNDSRNPNYAIEKLNKYIFNHKKKIY
ncbi:Uncharacterised protein [uncultured archaeon]|nr:Uncharacterised protein [uncultured archaeon]